jgi:hypothetical protein
MRHTHRRLSTGVLVAGLALLLAGAMLQTATAAPVKSSIDDEPPSLVVRLGAHRFGHLSAPDAIVATAGPNDVGFWEPPNGGDGAPFGPWSFDVAEDGSVWLLDEVNNRLLVWSPDRPDRPARTVPLPFRAPVDFALGLGGTVYVFSAPAGERHYLYALTSTGQVRWKARTIVQTFNAQLRMGPDGTLYYYDPGEVGGWVPVVTQAGRPLSLAEQRRRTSPRQPLPGGLRLVTAFSRHEARFALINRANQVVRAWRVTSRTELWPGPATPALIGGDLVVALGVTQATKTDYLLEHLLLRLAPPGGTRRLVALDPRAVWGDSPITGLRV